MQFSLRQVRYFVAAAERGSVTAAARALAVSQPSVSAAIADLEARFGVQLMRRHHAQGVSLTPAGRRMVAEGRRLLDHAREFEGRARGLGEALEGTLDVGCFLTIAPVYVPQLLAELKTRYPAMTVRIHDGHHETVCAGLENGAYELAIVYDMGLGKETAARTLMTLPPYAALPAGHRLSRMSRVSLKDLAVEPLVLLDLPSSREYFLSLFYSLGLEPLIGARTPSYELLRSLVANGHGYALLNTLPKTDVAYDGRPVIPRPLKEDLPATRIVIAHPADARLTRMAQAFADFAVEHFAKHHAARAKAR
ncbi:MAG: LysR family transcriptional regulator [Alphaproteobacteria bacterium]